MTFPPNCELCGGPIIAWDDEFAKCGGYCGLPVERIENLSPEQRRRYMARISRLIEIDTASEVYVQEAFL